MSDRGDVKDRVRRGQSVIARMIAERAFLAQRLLGVNVALDDKIRVGRHFEIVGLAFDDLERLFAQIASQQKLIQAVRQRRRGAER